MDSVSSAKVRYSLHFDTHGDAGNPQIILLHGIATNRSMWHQLIAELQFDYFIINIDLLGHGNSDKPKHISYSANLQADSIYDALERHGYLRPSIIIGFSIGALIGARLTASHPELVSANIFVAPPVYQLNTPDTISTADQFLNACYNIIQKLPPNQTLQLLSKIQKISPALIGNNHYNNQTWQPIMSTIANTVQEQNFARDLMLIPENIPVNILYGSFDHVVIKAHIKTVAKSCPMVRLQKVHAPHSLNKNYINSICNMLKSPVELVA